MAADRITASNPNDTGATVMSGIAELLGALDLDDIDDLETYCEDEMELLAVVRVVTDEHDVVLEIQPIGDFAATCLEFPFSLEFFHETLTDIEEHVIGFA